MSTHFNFSEDRRRGSRPTPSENPLPELAKKGYANWGWANEKRNWSDSRLKQFYADIKNGLTREVNVSANGNLYLIVCDEKKWFCTVDCSD